jgi:hypothetical protein
MAVANNPEPCIPMPTIPKRTRSLAGTARGEAKAGSESKRTVRAANEAPAAPAVVFNNWRRVNNALLITQLLCLKDLPLHSAVQNRHQSG